MPGQLDPLPAGEPRIDLFAQLLELTLQVGHLFATGGSALAAINVIERAGGNVIGFAAIVDLPDLGGTRKLEAAGYPVFTLCAFEGE